MAEAIRNNARTKMCRSKECAPDEDQLATVSVQLGKAGKSKLAGFGHLMELVKSMKESNVWKGSIKGYFFKGTIPTKMKSEIDSYTKTSRWKNTTTKRMMKSGILWRSKGKRYLLIFGKYRGAGNRIYCSLTII